jgi:hypothetical protein
MAQIGADQHAFGHAGETPATPGTPLSPVTRFLSGAAYIDQRYVQTVIDELVGQSHRAVAPALGYDVVTIVRHCLRAQRLWLTQNVLLTAVLLVGLFFFKAATLTVYGFCLLAYLVLPRAGRRRARRPAWRVVGKIAVQVMLVVLLLRWGWGLAAGTMEYGFEPTPDPSEGTAAEFLFGLAAVVLGLLVTLTAARYHTLEILTTDLARGQGANAHRPEAREVERRLAVIRGAQRGNVLLHAGFSPFVGAGEPVGAWSIATELRAAEPAGPVPPPRVDIDPVHLMHHLRQRLAALRSRDLPESTRIVGLQLRDQVISSGTRWHDFPLIDDASRLPYSFADPATVEAIIRAPQTSARHFLRVTVGDADHAAVAEGGRTIMPAEHQSMVNSTFIHVAVEGGMLYVELVATALGPIRREFLNIDRHVAGDDKLVPAAKEAFRRFLGDVAGAPVRLARVAYRRFTLVGAIHRADHEAASEPVYDFGARFDVRKLAADPTFATYLQLLDAEKYTRLIERRATRAIHDYLLAQGVDTSDFAGKVNQHQSTNIAIDTAYGPIAAGAGATATQSGANITTAVPGSAKVGAGGSSR